MADCNHRSNNKKAWTWRDCETVEQILNYLRIYGDLGIDDLAGVKKVTGCKSPCSYHEYVAVGKKLWQGDFGNLTTLTFGLSFASMEVTVKKEILIYPLTSFLAEVGGSLGMFLGFSLLTVWDLVISTLHYLLGKK